MMYSSTELEQDVAVRTALKMAAAARTAPKTRGVDNIVTLVLTGDEKTALADAMRSVAKAMFGDKPNFIVRDAGCLDRAQAVVLIGAKKAQYGLNCGYCGFADCAACAHSGGRCVFQFTDLGIAVGSAVSVAADERADNRVMFSIGRAAAEMRYEGFDGVTWLGIPVCYGSKNPFFDRK